MKILFVASNPNSTSHLALDEEIRSIENSISVSLNRSQVTMRSAMASRPLDLIRELNRHQPDILHISAHGSEDGAVIFSGENGEAKPVEPRHFFELFDTLDRAPTVVVLNSCFSFAQANELTQAVDVVIGLPHVVSDSNAIDFSTILYMNLCDGRSVSTSFKQAIIGVKLNNSNYWQNGEPSMLTKAGINTSQLTVTNQILAAPIGETRAAPRTNRRLFRDRDTGRGFLKRDFGNFCAQFTSLSLLFFDVEGMGRINNQFGRKVGDRVLTEIYLIIEDSCPDSLACGICGDDTFFCVIEDSNRQNVMKIGRSLMEEIEVHDWRQLAPELYVRVAGGFAIWNPERESPSDCVVRAGSALRTSQSKGTPLSEGSKGSAPRLRGHPIEDRYQIPEETMRGLFS